jgi:hypothetical protein
MRWRLLDASSPLRTLLPLFSERLPPCPAWTNASPAIIPPMARSRAAILMDRNMINSPFAERTVVRRSRVQSRNEREQKRFWRGLPPWRTTPRRYSPTFRLCPRESRIVTRLTRHPRCQCNASEEEAFPIRHEFQSETEVMTSGKNFRANTPRQEHAATPGIMPTTAVVERTSLGISARCGAFRPSPRAGIIRRDRRARQRRNVSITSSLDAIGPQRSSRGRTPCSMGDSQFVRHFKRLKCDAKRSSHATKPRPD